MTLTPLSDSFCAVNNVEVKHSTRLSQGNYFSLWFIKAIQFYYELSIHFIKYLFESVYLTNLFLFISVNAFNIKFLKFYLIFKEI